MSKVQLQMYPAAKIIESIWYPDIQSNSKWKKNAIRTALVAVCMAISLAGYSSVDNLVAIIGAVGCIPLAIIYPALFHWKINTRSSDVSFQWLRFDLFVVGFGVSGVLIAVCMATRSWILSHFQYQQCDF